MFRFHCFLWLTLSFGVWPIGFAHGARGRVATKFSAELVPRPLLEHDHGGKCPEITMMKRHAVTFPRAQARTLGLPEKIGLRFETTGSNRRYEISLTNGSAHMSVVRSLVDGLRVQTTAEGGIRIEHNDVSPAASALVYRLSKAIVGDHFQTLHKRLPANNPGCGLPSVPTLDRISLAGHDANDMAGFGQLVSTRRSTNALSGRGKWALYRTPREVNYEATTTQAREFLQEIIRNGNSQELEFDPTPLSTSTRHALAQDLNKGHTLSVPVNLSGSALSLNTSKYWKRFVGSPTPENRIEQALSTIQLFGVGSELQIRSAVVEHALGYQFGAMNWPVLQTALIDKTGTLANLNRILSKFGFAAKDAKFFNRIRHDQDSETSIKLAGPWPGD